MTLDQKPNANNASGLPGSNQANKSGSNSADNAGNKSGNQDRHLKAAQHLEQASKSHKDTAKQLEDGDQDAASEHAKKAAEHLAQATEQIKMLLPQGSASGASPMQR